MQKIIVFIAGILLCAVVDTIDAKQLKRPGGAAVVSPVRTAPISNPIVTQPIMQPIVQPQVMPVMSSVDKNAVMQKLNRALLEPVDNQWNERVDDLLFDLAAVDREMAREYFTKIHQKLAAVESKSSEAVVDKPVEIPVVQPGDEPMKVAPKKGPPSGGPKKLGAPSGGPAKKLGAPSGGPKKQIGVVSKKPGTVEKETEEPVQKGPMPLSIKETPSRSRLDKASNDELLKLFKDLLDALVIVEDFWNGKVVPTKPALDWETKINAVKNALLKRPDIKIDYNKEIADRIIEVREIKKQEAHARASEREKQAALLVKPKEELTEDALQKKITALFKVENPADFKWLIEIQKTIKDLYTMNPEEALKREQEYLGITHEKKGFLKEPTVKVQPKELTEEERLIKDIDQMFAEKGAFFMINVVGKIKELDALNHEKALEYHAKYMKEKRAKPFLQP